MGESGEVMIYRYGKKQKKFKAMEYFLVAAQD